MTRTIISSTALGLLVAAVTGGIYPATAGVGAWSDGAKASGRLIAEGVNAEGRLSAGIEIILPPGWKTYWRMPGDAGIAPQIDFGTSDNVGAASVRFPTPHRYEDGYGVTNIYEDRVVLPVEVPVLDPTRPVHLEVNMNLGVCEVVCIPDAISMDLEIEPGERDGFAAALLAAARQALPAKPEPGVFAVTGVNRDGGTDKRPVFVFNAVVPDAENAEVFVEGPYGWFPDVPKYTGRAGAAAAYQVKFSRLGAKTPIEGAAFTVLIVSGDRAIEQVIHLD